MFFHNHANYYLVGFDPYFLYQFDPEKYLLWTRVGTDDLDDAETLEAIRSFGASYVLISNLAHRAGEAPAPAPDAGPRARRVRRQVRDGPPGRRRLRSLAGRPSGATTGECGGFCRGRGLPSRACRHRGACLSRLPGRVPRDGPCAPRRRGGGAACSSRTTRARCSRARATRSIARTPELTYAMRPSADARFRRHEFSTRVETNALRVPRRRVREPSFHGRVRHRRARGLVRLRSRGRGGGGFLPRRGRTSSASTTQRSASHNLCTSGYSQRQHLAQIDLARELGARLAVVARQHVQRRARERRHPERRLDEGGLEHVVSGRRGESRKKVVEAAAWVARNSRLASTVAVRVLGVGRQGAGSTPRPTTRCGSNRPSTRRSAPSQETSSLLAELERACSAAGLGLAFVSIPRSSRRRTRSWRGRSPRTDTTPPGSTAARSRGSTCRSARSEACRCST